MKLHRREEAKPMDKRSLENDILLDLFHHRILSISQLKQMYFSNSKHYVYRKTEIMRRRGLIQSKPHVKNGQKVGAVYYITQKGINQLLDQGLIAKKRRWDENIPDWKYIEYYLNANELLVHLRPRGFHFYDSRTWKKMHNIDRNSFLSGGLVNKDGKEYSTYILHENARDNTIKKVKTELKSKNKLNRTMIFFKTGDTYRKFSKDLDAELTQFECYLMPFAYIYKRLSCFPSSQEFISIIEQEMGPVRPIGDDWSDSTSFADFIVTNRKNGQEYYVSNQLWNDVAGNYKVSKYPEYLYQNDRRKILIVTWSEMESMFFARYNNSPYVEVLPISLQSISHIV